MPQSSDTRDVGPTPTPPSQTTASYAPRSTRRSGPSGSSGGTEEHLAPPAMRPPPEAPPPDVSELLSADGQQDQQVAMGGDAQPCGSSSGAEAADSESAPLAPSATPAAALSADHRGEGGGGPTATPYRARRQHLRLRRWAPRSRVVLGRRLARGGVPHPSSHGRATRLPKQPRAPLPWRWTRRCATVVSRLSRKRAAPLPVPRPATGVRSATTRRRRWVR